jgi:hypothetical protein
MLPQWMWKVLQIAVFGGLTVFFFEVAGKREFPMLAALILSLALTALIFAPFLHIEMWMEKRRARRLGIPVPTFEPPESPLSVFVREARREKARRHQSLY